MSRALSCHTSIDNFMNIHQIMRHTMSRAPSCHASMDNFVNIHQITRHTKSRALSDLTFIDNFVKGRTVQNAVVAFMWGRVRGGGAYPRQRGRIWLMCRAYFFLCTVWLCLHRICTIRVPKTPPIAKDTFHHGPTPPCSLGLAVGICIVY